MAVLATGAQLPGAPGLSLWQRVTAPQPAAGGRLATLRLSLHNPQPLGLALPGGRRLPVPDRDSRRGETLSRL